MRQAKRINQLFALIAFAFLVNLSLQHMKPSGLVDWHITDYQQAYYMMTDHLIWPKEIGVDTFQTYGPMYRYLNMKIGPVDQGIHFLPKILYLSLHFLIIALFARGLDLPFKYLFIAGFFALFNFPFLGGSPVIMTLWALCPHRDRSKKHALTHLACGVLFAAMTFLYKPSLGIACMIQVMFTGLFHAEIAGIASRIKWLLKHFFSFGLLSLLIYLCITSGGISSFIQFVRISINDTGSYPHWNIAPSEWANELTYFYPLILALVLSSLAFFKVSDKRLWLPLVIFPVIFVDYKHAYVRADITNIGSIYQIAPIVFFFTLLRYWRVIPVIAILSVVLILSILLGRSEWDPYNTPYRHPRLVYIKSPQTYVKERQELQKKSQQAYESFFRDFDWVSSKVQGKSLASVPANVVLSKLGEPYILPSHQPLYGFNSSLRSRLDLDLFSKSSPDFVLYENWMYDERSPMSNRMDFYLDMLSRYDFVDRHKRFYLFQKSENQQQLKYKSLKTLRGSKPYEELSFTLPLNAIVYARGKNFTGPLYRLRSLLVKGDRVAFEYRSEKLPTKKHRCNYIQLEEGTLFPLHMPAYVSKNTTLVDLKMKVTRSTMAEHPHDPANYFKSNFNYEIEFGYYQKP